VPSKAEAVSAIKAIGQKYCKSLKAKSVQFDSTYPEMAIAEAKSLPKMLAPARFIYELFGGQYSVPEVVENAFAVYEIRVAIPASEQVLPKTSHTTIETFRTKYKAKARTDCLNDKGQAIFPTGGSFGSF
jgi:hypothetical protein